METHEIEYSKPNQETYHIRQRPSVPPVRHISLWLLLPLFIFILLGGYLTYSSLSIQTTGQITYAVNGNANYQVYLKENDYYDQKYLESGKQYIASLIDTVRADFNYALESEEPIDAHYEYEIIATATATDKNDETKVLYEKTDTLKTGTLAPIENGAIDLSDYVNIDYGQYNQYMKNFRSDFGISAKCFLNLKMIVKVDGQIKAEDTLSVIIPLSDQTIDISIQSKDINREDKIGEPSLNVSTDNLPFLIIGIVVVLTSCITGIIVICLYCTRFGDNWYAEAEYKINKNYDTHIVNATNSYREDGDVTRVSDFIELLDASRNEGSPIVRYNVDPEYKSYYVVSSNNGLKTYRYTLSRVYQDELRTSKQGKEVF